MNLKGQNLRLKWNGNYIAAALNCNIHLSCNTIDVTTKDTPSDASEIMVVSKSMEITTDALFTLGSKDVLNETTWKVDSTMYTTGKEYELSAGDTITVTAAAGVTITIQNKTEGKYTQGQNSVSVKAKDAGNFVVGTNKNNQAVTITIERTNFAAAEIIDNLVAGEALPLDLWVTEGIDNRGDANILMMCDAVVTDISINAKVNELTTYTAQFKATGEVFLNFEDGSVQSFSLNADDDEQTTAEEPAEE